MYLLALPLSELLVLSSELMKKSGRARVLPSTMTNFYDVFDLRFF